MWVLGQNSDTEGERPGHTWLGRGVRLKMLLHSQAQVRLTVGITAQSGSESVKC